MAPHRKQILTPVMIRSLKPGRHADGDGLYLLVEPTGAKRWMLRVVIDGRRRDIGLGGYTPGWEPKPSVDLLSTPLHPGSIAATRREAARLRAAAKAGRDPVAERAEGRAADRAKRKTFKEYAVAYIETHSPGWKNEKHQQQWKSTLETYVYPAVGDVAIGRVDRAMILSVLRPIWTAKPETASRVRGRVEKILDAAKADDLRTGDNPAAWVGGLEGGLPPNQHRERVVHHPALPYRDVHDFLVDLRARPGNAARALEFLILTATRTSEVINARVAELDEDAHLWIIPKSRMKAGKEHRVPLSAAAEHVLTQVPRTGTVLFPGPDGKTAMSNMAMLSALKRMGRADLTVHGFRSCFRDWAAEQTGYPREVLEHALAHGLANSTEAAYQRGDLLQKRRRLMDDWARYCATPAPRTATVTQFHMRSAAA